MRRISGTVCAGTFVAKPSFVVPHTLTAHPCGDPAADLTLYQRRFVPGEQLDWLAYNLPFAFRQCSQRSHSLPARFQMPGHPCLANNGVTKIAPPLRRPLFSPPEHSFCEPAHLLGTFYRVVVNPPVRQHHIVAST